VIRILCRITADETVYKDNTQAMKAFTPLAELLLDKKKPGQHNEAMMELGATLCTKANPQCSICPLATACKAKGMEPEKLPQKAARKIKKETIDRAWVEKEGRILLHRANGKSRRLSGILELPQLELLNKTAVSLKKSGQSPFVTRKRGISNSHITEPIWKLSGDMVPDHPDLEWIALKKLNEATLSGPHKRWINEILKHG
jgi:A/G-specific adenine glycosylase